MTHANPFLRQLAGLLACLLVLLGTTGAAALDALVHADEEHAAQHHENRGGPEPQGSDCVLCVAAAPPGAAPSAPLVPAPPAFSAAGDVGFPATGAPHATSYYLTPPGRGPPPA
jgi:hypothetical protein